MSDENRGARTLKVLLYSDDRSTRDNVRLALGRRLASDLPEIEIFDTATAPAAQKAVAGGGFDLLILDAEAVPLGGMGLSRQFKDELTDCPPIVLLVARVADAWLATWSNADAIEPLPVDPIRLPRTVAEVARKRLATTV
ncbi:MULTISPECIES: response regulator [unclassified Luteococcus]|uniref:response regulator n=1 Tax=unclassified Luteococcus TaxID=2639923 RepID=UPI00313BE5C2